MKNKLFFLSTIISSCILSIACNQLAANEMYPNMQGGRRPCYPSTKCTGDPNLIGPSYGNNPGNMYSNYGYSNQSGMNGYGAPTGKILQTDSSEKFTGVVRSINRVNLPNQTQVQMILSTDQGDLLVIVGPAQFLDQQRFKFAAGDKVTVSGYRITANGQVVITAAQIQKNGNTLQLLNERRQPIWGNRQN